MFNLSDLSPGERRSFVLGLLNGAAFLFAESLIDTTLVLTNFVSKLTTSNFLIGLVVLLREAGWLLPQLVVSSFLQRRDRVLPIYRQMAVVRSMAWIGMAAAVFLIPAQNAAALLWVFFALYTVSSLAGGVSGLSFMDVVAKTIPSRRRGSFFGGRLFFGSLLGLVAAEIIRVLLGGGLDLSYFAAIGLLFLLSWVIATLGLLAFSLIREPRGQTRAEPTTLGQHVRRAARLPRQDREFRLLLIARVALTLSFVAVPFYGVYATRELGAPDSMIGTFLAARTLSYLVANPFWARLSDRGGNRRVLVVAVAIWVLMAALALSLQPLLRAASVPPAQWSLVYVSVFVLWGLAGSGIDVGTVNLLLDLAPASDRVIYIGLTHTVLGVTLLSTSMSGLLADLIGLPGVFFVSLLFAATSLLAFYRMQEPRRLTPEPALHA